MLLLVGALGALLAGAALAEDPFAVPDGLLIGAGTSAVQTEGAWNADGKGESSTDYLLHLGKLAALGFGDPHQHDVAADSYHRFREDVAAAHKLQLKLYRFSLSWSRLLPNATASQPNELGVKFYNDLIDEILKYNITPMITLYHFDHPQILEKRFKGWQGEEMVDYFEEYARFAFDRFGDRVKLWTTINEANMYCTYFPQLLVASGVYTPEDANLYQCLRHTVLGHAKAYHAFKQSGREGQIGFTALLMHARPNSTLPEDVYAAKAFNEMHAGTTLHPVAFGDYPEMVKKLAGDKLPPYSDDEKQLINGTSDFFGFNVYYGMLAGYQDPDLPNEWGRIPIMGKFVEDTPFLRLAVNGVDPSNFMGMFSLIAPDALRSAAVWAWETYGLPMVITENGFGDMLGLGEHDHNRAAYHSAFLRTLVSTMKEFKIKVLGYAAWSLIDSFEWSAGFGRPFGLVHVDYAGGSLNRSLKDSASFWTELARTGAVPLVLPDPPSTAAPPPTAAPPSGAAAPASAAALLGALAAAWGLRAAAGWARPAC